MAFSGIFNAQTPTDLPGRKRNETDQTAISDTPTQAHARQDDITEITEDVLEGRHSGPKPLGDDWYTKKHKHITIRKVGLLSLESFVRLAKAPDLHNQDMKKRQDSMDKKRLDLTQLLSFDVSGNKLRDISCIRGTTGFSSLEVLKAKKNVLTHFEANLPKLKELDLSHNSLKEIPPTSGMPELETFILSHNKMNGGWEPLRHLKALKKLDISNNGFTLRPTELATRLNVLETLSLLHHLKVKDNPFCRLLPEYQAFFLQRLKGLNKFDDVDNTKEAREQLPKELSMEWMNEKELAKRLEEYDKLVFERGKADRMMAQQLEDSKPGEGKAREEPPTFQDLMDPVTYALADSSTDVVSRKIKELIRICDKIYELPADQMPTIFRDLKSEVAMRDSKDQQPGEKDIIEARVMQFLGDSVLLYSRIGQDASQRVMLVRCLAKMARVHTYELGDKCMQHLAFIMKKNDEAERETLAVIKEIIVEPLTFASFTEPQTLVVLKGLANRLASKMSSPRLADALSPIAGWLAKHYCTSGASPQQDVTKLLATATSNQMNTERALNFQNADAGALKSESLPSHVVQVFENKTLSQNESLREPFMCHLLIVRNTAKYGGSRVIEVYEEKGLHRTLVNFCKTFFNGTPIDMQKPYTKAVRNQVRVDIEHAKILDIRTCARLLEAIEALMEGSHDILLDLADTKPPQGCPVVEYYLVAPTSAAADPVLLAASLQGLYLILKEYSHENATARNEMINLIIQDLQKMTPMLEYLKPDEGRYRKLWQKAEAHKAEKAEGKSEIGQVPKLTALTDTTVHVAFEAIVMIIKYFTENRGSSKLCAAVSKEMDRSNREQILFQLLQVPSDSVRSTVMATLGQVDASEMSTDEVRILIDLLTQSKDLARELNLLERVVTQLKKFAADYEGAGAGLSLRTHHALRSIDAVMMILVKSASRKTYNAQDEASKTLLSQACVAFLKTVSKWPDLKETNLRWKSISGSLVDVLKSEDEFHSITNADITIEGTWTGRSVETLLQCFAGTDRLKARGRVAYRVLCRIADILEGRSDTGSHVGETERSSKESAALESEMWDESSAKRDYKLLEETERTDRALQQAVFGNFNGLDRLASFLTDLFGTVEQKQRGRRSEQAALDNAINFLKTTKNESKNSSDGQEVGVLEDGSDEDDDEEQDFKVFSHSGATRFPMDEPLDASSQYPSAWGNEVSISFKASCTLKARKSCIIYLGNGCPNPNDGLPADSIVVLCDDKDLVFKVHDEKRFAEVKVSDILDSTSKEFLCTMSQRGTMQVWVDGEQKADEATQIKVRPVRRRQYLIGSCVQEGDLKDWCPHTGAITDIVVWCGFKEFVFFQELRDGGERIDRKLVMKVMNRFYFDKPPPKKPELKMGNVLGSSVPRALQIREDFIGYDGKVNAALPIAATLRSCFALVKMPAAESIKNGMVAALKDELMVGHLLSLLQLCGPFDCCVAAKFMKLMSAAYGAKGTQAQEDSEQIVIFDLLATYIASLCQVAVRAASQQDNQKLQSRGFMLALEMVRLSSVIVKTIAFCTGGLPADETFQSNMYSTCLEHLMPLHVVQSFLAMALEADYAQEQNSAQKQQKSAKDSEMQDQIWESLKVLISALLDQCPKMKYDVFLIISQNVVTGKIPMRQSFLQGVLTSMKQSEQAKKLENFAPPPKAALAGGTETAVQPLTEEKERTVALAKVEVVSTDKQLLQVRNPNSEHPFLALVITNKALMVVDASVDGYPETPTIVPGTHRDVAEMTRIVKGAASQVFYVGLARNGWDNGEEFITFICHRETERNNLLSTLRAQSIPRGAPQFYKVPLYTDVVFKKAMEDQSVETNFLMASFLMCEEKSKERSLKLLVLSEAHLHTIKVNFDKWMPPDIAIAEEIGSDSGGEESGGEDGGMKAEVGANAKKKQEDEQMLGAIFSGGGQNDPAKKQAEELNRNRRQARAKGTGQKMEDALNNDGDAGLLEASPPIRIDNLEKVAFYPDHPPRMALTHELEDTYLGGTERLVLIFFDEFTKESWKRHVINLLQKKTSEASKWEPRFKSADKSKGSSA